MNMMTPNSKLYRRIDELEEQVRQLKEIINPKVNPFTGIFNLSPQLSAILYALYRNEFATMDYLDVVTLGHARSGGRRTDEFAVSLRTKVAICKIRARLRRHGIRIHNIWGVGYKINPADKRRIIKLKGRYQ